MPDDQISIQLLGGASAIGASCALVEVAGQRILIDCGVRFEKGRALPDLAQLAGGRLDAILVTHAHTDHTGALPVVHDTSPGVPIHATPPTIELVRILQRDALAIMDDRVEQEGDLPLYGERQVAAMLAALVPVHHGQSVRLGEVEATFLPASHILGASMVHLATPAGSVLFTGDFSVGAQRTVPALDRPALPVDLLVTESTYGQRLHADRQAEERRLVAQVAEVLERGGRVLVPAFAIGRAQEVLLILKEALRDGLLPRAPIYADGMVRAVCEVYARHERYATRALAHSTRNGVHPFWDERVRPVRDAAERRALLDGGPCVIVASSGMLAGGPSAFYAQAIARSPADAILVTGYQDEESPGRTLLRLAESEGPRTLRLGDATVDVACTVASYSLSAHADRMEIAGLAAALRPQTTVLVHGDESARRSLRDALGDGDVLLGEDGARITRRYAKRSRGGVAVRSPSRDQAERLLAPFSGKPVRATTLARGWLGATAGKRECDAFVAALEEHGLVRRDDEDRTLVWVNEGSATAEEEALERENPKGKLLELCRHLQIAAPVRTVTGGCVELAVESHGERVSSGAHRHASPDVAEQLAARALLARLQEAPDEVFTVDEERAAALKRVNPKGQLLERCARDRLGTPVFETHFVPGGFAVRARLDGHAIVTASFFAAQRKVAEQAAAAALMAMLPASIANDSPAQATGEPAPDPRSALNELRQRGFLADYGFDLVEHSGPSHSPTFTMRGWAALRDGRRLDSGAVRGPNKKDAQLAAARALLALVGDALAAGRGERR